MAHTDSPFSPNEETRIAKDVERDLKEARRAVATLNKLHDKLKPRKTTPSMGSVPRSIYNKNVVTQTDVVSRLPNELQDMVWEYLVHQADRMAFALSCKANAYKQDQLTGAYNRIAIKGPKKQHRLAVLIRLSVGIVGTATTPGTIWVPTGYRVCFECTRFCLRISKSDWSGDTAMIDEKYVKEGYVTKDALVRGPKCPRCKYVVGVQHLGNKACVKEYKTLLRKHIGPVN